MADVADAHLRAMDRAARIGFGKYIVSATTPFTPADLAGLRDDAPAVVRRLFPDYEAEYARRGWRMFPSIGRVYVNARARADLGWSPRYDFRAVLDALKAGQDPRSPLAQAIGAKGYHDRPTGVYTELTRGAFIHMTRIKGPENSSAIWQRDAGRPGMNVHAVPNMRKCRWKSRCNAVAVCLAGSSRSAVHRRRSGHEH